MLKAVLLCSRNLHNSQIVTNIQLSALTSNNKNDKSWHNKNLINSNKSLIILYTIMQAVLLILLSNLRLSDTNKPIFWINQ